MMRRMVAAGLAAALAAHPAGAGQVDSMTAARAEGAAAPAPDAVIRYGPDDIRSGELRLPPGKGPFPVAFLVHGGCWSNRMGSRGEFASVAEALRRRGFATWNIEYRRVGDPGGGWPGTFQDVAVAADHLPALARRYPLDLKRVVFVGHSAGAHLAAWAASRPKQSAPWRASLRPAALAIIDGPVGLAEFVGVDAKVCGAPAIAPLMGDTPAEKPEEYRLASASDDLPLGVRQLIVLGALTPLMRPYVEAARRSGDPVEVLAPPGADLFDIVTPGTPNGRAVADFIAARAFAK